MHQAQVSRNEAGYAMAALLVAMALMAVLMSVAMPVWRQAAQREKEAELVWRGQQYDRALQLFRRKAGAPGAPNLDILIEQKFLRKKYKDPITGDDFELKPVVAIREGSPMPGVPGACNQRPGIGTRSSSSGNQTPASGRPPGRAVQSGAGAQGSTSEGGNAVSEEGNQPFGLGRTGSSAREPGPNSQRGPGQLIGGVRSKSKARSIRELNGRTRYDQWEFVYVPYNPNPQPPGVGGQQPRMPGQRRPGSSSGIGSAGSQRPGAATVVP
jgi:type II secretory pathway pseudopilin PulG